MRHKNLIMFLSLIFIISISINLVAYDSIHRNQTLEAFPIKVRNGDEKSFSPNFDLNEPAIVDPQNYDTIIIGGGISGLTAALYLTDQNKNVLLLEKESVLGGLAAGAGKDSPDAYARGAVYWGKAYEEQLKIFEHIGLGDYEKRFPIIEPSDNYLYNGKLYIDIWADDTVKNISQSFTLFKQEVLNANNDGLIPDQPIENADDLTLDKLSALAWIEQMPKNAEKRAKKAGPNSSEYRIWNQFKSDPFYNPDSPMKAVIDFLNLYCRSSLGANLDKVSAIAFANFYFAEFETRYSTPIGNAGIAKSIGHLLREKDTLKVEIKAPVVRVDQDHSKVTVHYLKDGKHHIANSAYCVFAGAIKFAPKIISDMNKTDPVKFKTINNMQYSHYAVHVVKVKGHPYRASYDTWVRAADYTDSDLTDVIISKWMDPKINGYLNFRDHLKSPAEDHEFFAVYQSISEENLKNGFGNEQAKSYALNSVTRFKNIFSPMLKETWGTELDIQTVETNRWPFGIHVATPGHFSKNSKILRRPVGRVYFANNNIGTPGIEEALFRGHCAANNILVKLNKNFKQENWSNCPLEK